VWFIVFSPENASPAEIVNYLANINTGIQILISCYTGLQSGVFSFSLGIS